MPSIDTYISGTIKVDLQKYGQKEHVNGHEALATSRKVAGSSQDEVDFSIYLLLPAAPWLWGRLSL
jgi:hypothetical protein